MWLWFLIEFFDFIPMLQGLQYLGTHVTWSIGIGGMLKDGHQEITDEDPMEVLHGIGTQARVQQVGNPVPLGSLGPTSQPLA